MILRRLAQNIKEQNWTAISIEFVLLVLGVFLGIQVANWNEARVEHGLVRGHLSEIALDLRAHDALSGEIENSLKLRIAAVDYIYQEAFGTALPKTLARADATWEAPEVQPFPTDRLNNLMGSVNLVRISVEARNGYQSMMSSGRLGLLKNRDLARQIQSYYGKYDELMDTQTNVFRPYRNDGSRELFELGISVFDQRPAAEIVALARDNPSFAAYLRSQREWGIANFKIVHDINLSTRTLLTAIEQELGKP